MNDKRDEVDDHDDDVTRRLTLKILLTLDSKSFFVANVSKHPQPFSRTISFYFWNPSNFRINLNLWLFPFKHSQFIAFFSFSKEVCRASNNQALSSRNWVCIKYLEGFVGRAPEFVVVKRDPCPPFSRLVKLFVGLWKSAIKLDYETRLEAPKGLLRALQPLQND